MSRKGNINENSREHRMFSLNGIEEKGKPKVQLTKSIVMTHVYPRSMTQGYDFSADPRIIADLKIKMSN